MIQSVANWGSNVRKTGWKILSFGILLQLTACSPTLTFEDPAAVSASPSPSPVVTLDAVDAPAPLQPRTYTLSGDCTPSGAQITLSATWVRAETSGTVDSTVTASCPESGSYSETFVVDSATPLGSLLTFSASAGESTDTARHFHTLQSLTATSGEIMASALDSEASDGPWLYLGGTFGSILPIPTTGIAAIPSDLTPNATSDLNALIQGAAGGVLAVAVAGDWIYLGGSFAEFRGESTGPLVKINLSTGELDPDFHSEFVDYFSLSPDPMTDWVTRLVVDESAQKLYVGGSFTNSDTSGTSIFARIDLETGAIDDALTQTINDTLGTTNFQDLAVSSSVIEICASSVCMGFSEAEDTFNPGYTGLNDAAGLLALDDGTFLVGDNFINVITSPDPSFSGIGAIDPADGSFTPWGGADWDASLSEGSVQSMTRSGDWIYATGHFVGNGSADVPLIRFDSTSGELDTTFLLQLPEEIAGLSGWSVSIDEDSQTAFLLALDDETLNLFAISIETGDLLASYGTGTDGYPTIDFVEKATFLQDQVLLTGSTFRSLGGLSVGGLARFHAETGTPDPSFNQASGSAASPDKDDGFNNAVNAIALDSFNQVLYAGGSFTTYRGAANVNRIAKINLTDGSLDPGFQGAGAAYGFDNTVYSLAFDSTLSVLYAGGRFTTYKTSSYVNRIAKLDADGSLFAEFSYAASGDTSDGFNSSNVYALALDVENSAVYAGGSFTTYRGATNVNRIAKINTTSGALDTSFAYESGASASTDGFVGNVRSIALNPASGDLFLGGTFTSYRGDANVNRIAKVDASNGTLDTTFAYASGSGASTDGFNSTVYALALSSEGDTIYAGGIFSRYRSASDNGAAGVAKLNASTGALASSFVYPLPANMDSPAGYAGTIQTLLLDSSNQRIFAGGSVIDYSGFWSLGGSFFDLLDGSPAFTDSE